MLLLLSKELQVDVHNSNILRSETLDCLRNPYWIRRPSTGSTLLLNVSNSVDVSWIHSAESMRVIFGTIEALHVIHFQSGVLNQVNSTFISRITTENQ